MEWINVKDKLPTNNWARPVLPEIVPDEYPRYQDACEAAFYENKTWYNQDGTEIDWVNHWLELPQPPEEIERNKDDT